MDGEQLVVILKGMFYHKVLDAVAELVNKQQRKIDHLPTILESKNENEKLLQCIIECS